MTTLCSQRPSNAASADEKQPFSIKNNDVATQ
jgi:hypothetical protein